MAPPLTGGSLIPQPKYRRFVKRVLCSLLVATLPFGSVLADAPKSKNAKVTLVYQHELPNVPGKSIKGVLVERSHSGTEVIVIAPAVRTADAFEFHCILKPFRRAREVSTCLASVHSETLSFWNRWLNIDF